MALVNSLDTLARNTLPSLRSVPPAPHDSFFPNVARTEHRPLRPRGYVAPYRRQLEPPWVDATHVLIWSAKEKQRK